MLVYPEPANAREDYVQRIAERGQLELADKIDANWERYLNSFDHAPGEVTCRELKLGEYLSDAFAAVLPPGVAVLYGVDDEG